MRVKEESEKADLKLSIEKTKIIASGPITSWQIEGEKVAEVTDFVFLDSKITADGDCTHEIKRCLLLGRKAMTNLGGGGNESCSVVSDSLQPHGLYSLWNSPGQSARVGSLSLLQGIFPTQRSNPSLPL